MQKRRLGSGDLDVSAIELGCMGMSWSYGPPKDKQEMISLLHEAVDRGVTFLIRPKSTGDGRLIMPSANPEQHWSVTWQHY
jgi:predicted oxidoreductase